MSKDVKPLGVVQTIGWLFALIGAIFLMRPIMFPLYIDFSTIEAIFSIILIIIGGLIVCIERVKGR